MSGLFGVIGKRDCVEILFYGTDYHSHLGTSKAGLAVFGRKIYCSNKDISTSQFKSVFLPELGKFKGKSGIGVISDSDAQPLVFLSSSGYFALAFSGFLQNKNKLFRKILKTQGSFSYLDDGKVNSVEILGKMISNSEDIVEGIKNAISEIQGSATLLVLNKKGIFCVRDKFGRTPLIIGKSQDFFAVAQETSAFPNLFFEPVKELLSGQIVLLTKDKIEEIYTPSSPEKICAFLWIYTGYPASIYDGITVESVRQRCGINLAKNDKTKADFVTGIPDSGIAHALGYAIQSRLPYKRALVKYTPGYSRSYTPPSQKIRNMVAQMKLIPVRGEVSGKKIIICDDSIVRGTQLKNQAIEKLWRDGAKEIHVRIACPPLLFPCKYLFSTRTKGELAARRAIKKVLKNKKINIQKLLDENSEEYKKMVEELRKELGVTSLKYQKLKDMIEAIGVPPERLCLFCWTGEK